MIKNILLAFDGSEYSYRALQYAKMFADRFEATLFLVHIFTHTSDLLGYEDYEKFYSKRKASGQTLLNEAFQELSNSSCKVREKLEEGPLSRVNSKYCQELQSRSHCHGNTWAWYIEGFASWQCKPQSHSPFFLPSNGSALASKIPMRFIRQGYQSTD